MVKFDKRKYEGRRVIRSLKSFLYQTGLLHTLHMLPLLKMNIYYNVHFAPERIFLKALDNVITFD